ncbi:hypothetical protein [Persephonella sp.]
MEVEINKDFSDINISSNELIKEIYEIIISEQKNFLYRIKLSLDIEKAYRKYADNDFFRTSMENLFLKVLEKKFNGDIKSFLDIMKNITLSRKVRLLFEEDLEEAIETYKMKNFFENNKEKLDYLLSDV